jgi:hypothetical protein
MRVPIRSERDAFRATLAAAALIGCSVLLGWLTAPVVGALVFAVLGTTATIVLLLRPDPDGAMTLRDAVHDTHPHGALQGERHVLVVANDALAGDALLQRIADGANVEVDVLATVLTSPIHSACSDVDREIGEASERLRHSMAWAQAHGITARGEVGDPDPRTAIEDALRDFGADEVIVVTHPDDRATRQERQELAQLRRELDVPVTRIVAGAACRAD